MCDMTYSCVGHGVLICLISFIRLRYHLFFCMPTNSFDRFIWIRRVTHMQASCHIYERVISQMWRSHVTHMNQSYLTCEGVTSHKWISHVTHVTESRHMYETKSDMTPSCVWHDAFIRVTSLIHICDSCCMTHLCVWDMTHLCVWYDSFVRVTWLVCACDMTHLCVGQDSFVRVTWLIRACDMTHVYDWCMCLSACKYLVTHMCIQFVTHISCSVTHLCLLLAYITDACAFLCANISRLTCAYSWWLTSHGVRDSFELVAWLAYMTDACVLYDSAKGRETKDVNRQSL